MEEEVNSVAECPVSWTMLARPGIAQPDHCLLLSMTCTSFVSNYDDQSGRAVFLCIMLEKLSMIITCARPFSFGAVRNACAIDGRIATSREIFLAEAA